MIPIHRGVFDPWLPWKKRGAQIRSPALRDHSCSRKPPEQIQTLPPVITADNNLITAHRMGWMLWIHHTFKRTGHHISRARSVST